MTPITRRQIVTYSLLSVVSISVRTIAPALAQEGGGGEGGGGEGGGGEGEGGGGEGGGGEGGGGEGGDQQGGVDPINDATGGQMGGGNDGQQATSDPTQSGLSNSPYGTAFGSAGADSPIADDSGGFASLGYQATGSGGGPSLGTQDMFEFSGETNFSVMSTYGMVQPTSSPEVNFFVPNPFQPETGLFVSPAGSVGAYAGLPPGATPGEFAVGIYTDFSQPEPNIGGFVMISTGVPGVAAEASGLVSGAGAYNAFMDAGAAFLQNLQNALQDWSEASSWNTLTQP